MPELAKKKQVVQEWSSLNSSLMLFNYMIEEFEVPLDTDYGSQIDPKEIGHLMMGKKSQKNLPMWLFEIIKNERTGLDVDKLDYICRDNFHCGLNTSSHKQLVP